MKDDKELCPIHKKQEIAIIFMLSALLEISKSVYWKIVYIGTITMPGEVLQRKNSRAECSHDLEQSIYVSIIWYQAQ